MVCFYFNDPLLTNNTYGTTKLCKHICNRACRCFETGINVLDVIYKMNVGKYC